MVRDAFNASFELRTAPVFRGWRVGEWIIEDASGVETRRALVASPKCMPRRRRLRKYNNRAFPEEELEPLLGSQNSEEFMVPCRRRRRRRLLLRTTVRVTTYSRRHFPIHMHVALPKREGKRPFAFAERPTRSSTPQPPPHKKYRTRS